MIKRIFGSMILIPIIILFSMWSVNFISGVAVGEINLGAWVMNHRVGLGLIAAYFVFRFVNPFKK